MLRRKCLVAPFSFTVRGMVRLACDDRTLGGSDRSLAEQWTQLFSQWFGKSDTLFGAVSRLTRLRSPECPQYFGQSRTCRLQLFEMDFRKRPQSLFAFSRQLHQYAPAVIVIYDSPQQSELCDSVHQLDGCVMSNKKELRQITYGNGFGPGKAFDSKKRLVLLWRQPGFIGSRFAE